MEPDGPHLHHESMSTSIRFAELAATARNAGFELYDSRGLPVGEEHQPFLEDDNLMSKRATVMFHPPPEEGSRGVVADISVGQHVFQLHGDWSRVAELQHLLGGRAAPASRQPDLG